MKKLFVFAAALLALASCSQGDEPEATLVPTREITFATATKTRAAMDEVDETDLTDEGFAVLGMADAETIFGVQGGQGTEMQVKGKNNSQATQDGCWAPTTAADVKYWSTTAKYAFAAYHPINASTKFTLTEEGARTVNSYTNDGQTDFVVSDFINPFKLESGKTTATPVRLNFRHMLSRVKFTFYNGFEDTDVTVKITDIKLLGVGANGSATISTDNKPSWTIATDRIDLAYDNLDVLSNTKLSDETEYMTVIPEKTSLKVQFTIEALADGKSFATIVYADGDADAKHNAIALDEQDFVAGQGYDFKATIKIDKMGDVYPIEFDVEVVDWVEPTEETVIPGFGE